MLFFLDERISYANTEVVLEFQKKLTSLYKQNFVEKISLTRIMY